LKPRRIKTSPVHGISAYENANATPEMARDANNGSPSLRHALTSTEMHTTDRRLSEYASVEVSASMFPAVNPDALAGGGCPVRYFVDLSCFGTTGSCEHAGSGDLSLGTSNFASRVDILSEAERSPRVRLMFTG
jgi:hypothetical protein